MMQRAPATAARRCFARRSPDGANGSARSAARDRLREIRDEREASPGFRFAHPATGPTFPLNHRQLAVDYQQHAVEFVAAAQDQPARRDHAVDPCCARAADLFRCDRSVLRRRGGIREHRAVLEKVDGIVRHSPSATMRPYKSRIRLSSKRLNVTRLGKGPAAALRAAARLSLGRLPPTSSSWSASFCDFRSDPFFSENRSPLRDHAAPV